MTFLPDHRATHQPGEECDGCRSVDAVASDERPRQDVHRDSSVRRLDLVIQPGTNRK